MDTTTLKKMLADNHLSAAHLARANELIDAAQGGELSDEAKEEISEMLRLEIIARQQASSALDMADQALRDVTGDVVSE